MLRRVLDSTDRKEMTDSGRPDPVERTSGMLADAEAESVDLKESVGESIVRKKGHSNGAPTIKETGIHVKDVASAYDYSSYEPDEITELYPDLSLSDIHHALAYHYEHVDEFR